jgi:Xaa-Pro aminopeptidase
MLRNALLALCLAAPAVAPLVAQPADAPVRYEDDFTSAAFHEGRRAAVLERLPDEAIAVFFAAPERNRSNDVDYEYRQSSDFLYLTGSPEPGSALLLAPDGVEVDGRRVEEVLFVPPRDPLEEVWLGRRFGPRRAMDELGIEIAVEATRFDEIVAPLLADGDREVHHLPLPDAWSERSAIAPMLSTFLQRVSTSDVTVEAPAEGSQGSALRAILSDLRTIKTDEEMRLLRRAIDITAEAHRAVMQQVEPGWAEYEIEALVEYTFKKEGAEYPGFPSIVGSGENSVILHYESNRRTTQPGDVVVVDIGAEYHGYTADVTRTVPVDGVYSAEQRAIYEIVYRAQEAGIEAARAGSDFSAPHQAAAQVLAAGLAELGLIGSPTDAQGLGRFFMHGTSHYLGLDVHDVGSRGPLEPGTVITVEPGLYVPAADDIDPKWWNIGVRIEDDVLVTDGDPVILSADVPRQIDEVEALMARPGR